LFGSVFYPPKCENRVKMSEGRNFSDLFLERRVLRFHRGTVHPPAAIIDRAARADRSVLNPPFNRLVRGFLALLAFCHSFWAVVVSGAAAAANPRRRAMARREGARAHSYASRGAAAVPWAGRSGHMVAIWGAHGGALAPRVLGSTRRARRENSPILGAGHPTPRGPIGTKVGLRWPYFLVFHCIIPYSTVFHHIVLYSPILLYVTAFEYIILLRDFLY
jgi:hypothetical protein